MARWVRINVNLGFSLFDPVLVCICQAYGQERSDLIFHSKIWHKILVLLVKKAALIKTKTLETQIATIWKSAQKSPSSPAFGLSPSLPFSRTLGWAEVSLQQSHSSPPSACWPLWIFLDKHRRTSVFFPFASSSPRAKGLKVNLSLRQWNSASISIHEHLCLCIHEHGKIKLELNLLAARQNWLTLHNVNTEGKRPPCLG